MAEERAPRLAQLVDRQRDAALAHEARAAAARADEVRGGGGEAFAGGAPGAGRGAKAAAVLLEDAADDLGEQPALVGEVVVERRLRDRGVARDVVEGDAASAALAPEPIGRLKQSLTGRASRPAALRGSSARCGLRHPAGAISLPTGQ